MERPEFQAREGAGTCARRSGPNPVVMPGLVPGIHDLNSADNEFVDARDKPGHDDGGAATAGTPTLTPHVSICMSPQMDSAWPEMVLPRGEARSSIWSASWRGVTKVFSEV